MSPLRSALAAAGLMLSTLCVAGPAATVTVKFDNPIFSTTGSDGVTIVETTLGTAGVAAGRFEGEVVSYQGVQGSIFVDGLDNLFMYCYDITEHIGNGWQVEYAINFAGPTSRTLDVLGAVNWVMNNNSNTWGDKFAWLHPHNAAESAAIQLAIWESKYDNGSLGWDLTDGSFKATGLDAGTSAFWNQIVAAVGSADSLPAGLAMTLEARGAQDMITGDPPSNVPLPGTLALLGAGLAGLGVARRKPQR